MKTLFLFFFGITTLTSLLAQDKVNQFDENGKRHGVWEKYFEGTKQLRYKGEFNHGKEVGTFTFYCEECKEQPSVTKEFSKNDNSALITFYNIKGKVVSKGKMDGKKRVGEWITYHKNSEVVMMRENYLNDVLHGKKTTYFPNKQITEEITYNNGVKNGENLVYSEEGILLKRLNYIEGKLHGLAEYFDGYGNISIKGNYKKGKKDGLWRYYKNGKVELEETYPLPVKKKE